MFLNNVKFYVKSTITSTQIAGTTFNISEDFETNTHIETGSDTVSIVLKTTTQIERMTITATGGVATIVKRGLTQADTKVENVSYQKQWNDGTIGYVTAFASDLLDTDSANNTLNANITYEGSNTFNGNVVLNKGFRVPEFDDATERDTQIPTPEDGMMCYLQDVEDYYSYKNGIWNKGLGGSGGSVTWYQDSTDDGSITGTINGVNTTFTLSNTPAQPQAVIVAYNGQTLDYGSDYTITGKVITMILVPVSGKLTAIYPDTPVGTGSADTRVTTSADAHNGELFRNSGDSDSLYYKDNGGIIKDIQNRFNVTGEIKIWPTNTAPTSYLLCDGSAISRTAYSALFGVIGTTYGVGDGSTTFNLPNLKGKVVVGYDSTQTEFDTLGEIGGEKTHTLTIPEMPSHTHTGAVSPYSPAGGPYSGHVYGYGQTTDATGGGLAHNNLQPYITLNYIIKI